jgi:hypothetical protein
MAEARVTEIENGGPAACAACFARRGRRCLDDPAHLHDIAADNGAVQIVAGELRMPREVPLRRAVVHPVVAPAVRVMVPAGGLQERRHQALPFVRRFWRRSGADSDQRGLQRGPVVVSVFARERMVHVAQTGLRRCVGIGALQACARVRVPCADGFEPALGLFAEIFQSAQKTPSFRCAWRPLTAGRKKVRVTANPVGGRRAPLPRTGGAPERAAG